MKTTIGPKGELNIKAETDIEHYALARWFDDWREKKVTLHIEVTHPHTEGAVTSLNVTSDS